MGKNSAKKNRVKGGECVPYSGDAAAVAYELFLCSEIELRKKSLYNLNNRLKGLEDENLELLEKKKIGERNANMHMGDLLVQAQARAEELIMQAKSYMVEYETVEQKKDKMIRTEESEIADMWACITKFQEQLSDMSADMKNLVEFQEVEKKENDKRIELLHGTINNVERAQAAEIERLCHRHEMSRRKILKFSDSKIGKMEEDAHDKAIRAIDSAGRQTSFENMILRKELDVHRCSIAEYEARINILEKENLELQEGFFVKKLNSCRWSNFRNYQRLDTHISAIENDLPSSMAVVVERHENVGTFSPNAVTTLAAPLPMCIPLDYTRITKDTVLSTLNMNSMPEELVQLLECEEYSSNRDRSVASVDRLSLPALTSHESLSEIDDDDTEIHDLKDIFLGERSRQAMLAIVGGNVRGTPMNDVPTTSSSLIFNAKVSSSRQLHSSDGHHKKHVICSNN